jgi:hypothetical protein
MARSYKTSAFGSAKKSRNETRNISTVNGESTNIETDPEEYRIAAAIKNSDISINGNDSLGKKAKLLLEEVCEVSMTYDENFSLIESCVETEDDLITVEDKFPDSADQFYNLDGDQISTAAAQEYKDQEEEAETNVVSFAANLLGYSKDSNGKTTTNGQSTTNAVSTATVDIGTTTTKTTTTSY